MPDFETFLAAQAAMSDKQESAVFEELDPDDIRINLDTQIRVNLDADAVSDYTMAMQRGDQFPPIQVYFEETSGEYILADGFHRYTAHVSLHPNELIMCLVHEGDIADARIFACGANTKHGLRRTNEDKRKAVKLILQEPKCSEWSDRKIADYIKVSEALTRTIRAQLESSAHKTHLNGKRIGKDGKSYPVKTYAFDEEPEPETNYRTNANGNPRGEHAFHIRKKSVKCKLYPKNPQLSACEIRAELGEEFLFALQNAIRTITQEC
jgi:hypothetical protein